MPAFDGLLMRDSLSDTGVVPSPGYYYHSPDVIGHAQVTDPQAYFTGNYTSDPNQPVQLGSQVNYIYVRAKNLSTVAKSGWSAHVYRASSSLFMNTSQWKLNKLLTQSGQDYVTYNTVQSNQVVVGNDNFLLSGLSSNLFCMVGITSDTTTPNIPGNFSSYSAFVIWIRSNQNICVRNLTTIRSYANRQYDRLDNFSNPQSDSVPVLFQVTASGPLPSATTFGVECAPLGISKQQTISDGTILTASGMSTPNFSGQVTTFGALPSGSTQWPAGADLQTNVFVGVPGDDPAAPFAEDWASFPIKPHEMEGMYEDGILLRVGNCGTTFIA